MPKNRPIKNGVEHIRPNSLGLNSKQLARVYDLLERQSGQSASGPERSDARWPFRQPSVPVRIEHPGGSEAEMRMACRNLSKSGAGLLHNSFVYNGTRCTLTLPHPQNGDIQVNGEVVRCQHRGGTLHEIGVRFDREIDLRSFVRPNPLREWFAVEQINPDLLVGSLLCIEHSTLDAQLFRHFLRDTQVRVRVTADIEEAVECARNGVDLVLCEFHLEGITGEEVVMRFRGENIASPIILTSMDHGDRIMKIVDGRRAQAFLGKPVTEEKLLRALGEFLTRDVDPEMIDAESADRSLLQAMKPELQRCAKVIEVAIEKNQPMDIISTCMQLRNVAPTIGMTDITGDLDLIVGQLSASMAILDVQDEIKRITGRCLAA